MTETNQIEDVDEELCEEMVERVLTAISSQDVEGYDAFRTIDLLFASIIRIYKSYNFAPEDVVKAIYEEYDVTIQ